MHQGEDFQAAIPDPSSGYASDDDENRFLRCEPALSFEEAMASAEGPEKAAAEMLPLWARFDDVCDDFDDEDGDDDDDDESNDGTDGNGGDPKEVSPLSVLQYRRDSFCMLPVAWAGVISNASRGL